MCWVFMQVKFYAYGYYFVSRFCHFMQIPIVNNTVAKFCMQYLYFIHHALTLYHKPFDTSCKSYVSFITGVNISRFTSVAKYRFIVNPSNCNNIKFHGKCFLKFKPFQHVIGIYQSSRYTLCYQVITHPIYHILYDTS